MKNRRQNDGTPVLLLFGLLLLSAVGCSSSGSSSDADTDTDTDIDADVDTDVDADTDADTDTDTDTLPLDLSLPLGEGEVAAGVVTDQRELLSGPEAQGWLGDFKLYNARAAFIIQGIDEPPRGWAPFGGTLLDAVAIGEDGTPGEVVFQELFLNLDLFSLKPTAAEVVNDGRDGQAAVVRVQGHLQGMPLVDSALNGSIQPKDLELTTEYILEPDASYLRVVTKVLSRESRPATVHVGDVPFNGDLSADFAEGAGISPRGVPTGTSAYFGGFTADSCSLYTGAEGPITVLLSIEGITPVEAGSGRAPTSGDPLTVERLLIVGDGPMDACLQTYHELRGAGPLGEVTGTVTDQAGAAEAGAIVLARDTSLPADEDVVNQTYTDAGGAYVLHLPSGWYRIAVQAPGRDEVRSDEVSVNAGQAAETDVAVPPAAWLAYTCSGQDRAGQDTGLTPCRIALQEGHDAPRGASVDPATLTFALTGSGELAVPPGDWTVTLSRGWERSLHRENVTLAAGQAVAVNAVLQQQVDTTGYLAMDPHSHSGRSPETHYPITDKLACNIVQGVEVMAATDHDVQSDFSGYLAELDAEIELDLTRYLKTVTGNEVSPFSNHFTAFPLEVHPTGWIYWAIPWTEYADGKYVRQLEFPEIWPTARAQGARIINVAHPTGDKGWWSRLGFDPPDEMPLIAELPADRWSPEFDTIELLNSGAASRMINDNLPIWSHFNNQGFFRTATAVSDAHVRTDPQGYGMTYVAAATDVPGEVELDALLESLAAGRAVIGAGIFVRLSVGDGTVGDLVSQTAPFAVTLSVEAADWVEADQVVLLANGEEVAALPLAGPGEVDPAHPAVRLHDVVEVSPAADTWYAALATGPGGASLAPLCGGCRPVGLTNPIRVDVDGDGEFTPPLQ